MINSSEVMLKASGNLQSVGLRRLADSRARGIASLVDSELLAHRCCGTPDEPDPEIAAASIEDLQKYIGTDCQESKLLRLSHRRMEEAVGSGSWPASCHLDIYPHEDRHAVTYHLRRSTFNNNWLRKATESEIRHVSSGGVWPWSTDELLQRFEGKPMLDVAIFFVHEAYRRIGVKLIAVGEESLADIVTLCRNIPGSTIGLGYFPNGSCRDVVEAHLDSSWKPGLAKASLLIAHEWGHCHDLRHQFKNQDRHKSVLSYSWPNNFYGFLDGSEGILPRDASWPSINRFLGDEPIPKDDDPVTPTNPPTPTDGLPRTKDLELAVDGKIYIGKVTWTLKPRGIPDFGV